MIKGKRNRLSITLKWGYYSENEETFIDNTGRSLSSFFDFYKNDLVGQWDIQKPIYPVHITSLSNIKVLQPYFKHIIDAKKYKYIIIFKDENVEVDGEFHVVDSDTYSNDAYYIFQWWNKESKQGGTEIIKNKISRHALDWDDPKWPIPTLSVHQGFYTLFDHRDQMPGHPQEFFVEKLKEILGDKVNDMPISNDNYYVIRYLPWDKYIGKLTLLWRDKNDTNGDYNQSESHLTGYMTDTILANYIGVMPNPGLPGNGFYSWFTREEGEQYIKNMNEIAKFEHQADFDKYDYAIEISSVDTCFA